MDTIENGQKKVSKIWILGLDGAGKTSILLSLQRETNLMSYVNLNPTKGVKQVNLNGLNETLNIWDFGGQEQYRTNHLIYLDKYLEGITKIIYVIDIQDSDRYDLALDYLKEILDKIEKENIDIVIEIFFHKFDPGIQLKSDSPIIRKHIPDLRLRLKKLIPRRYDYSIFKTTIFTVFQKSPD